MRRTQPATVSWRDWSCAVTVTVSDARHLEAAADLVRDLMGDVDRAASRFRPDSDLERVNDAAGRLVVVRPLAFHLVEIALHAARLTGGAVDPTLGAALTALGYDADITVVRRRPRPASAPRVRTGDWRSVRLDRTLVRVGVPAGVRLDLGATAKAWTADEAARRVQRRFGGAAAIGLGGDLAVAGSPEGHRPWRIDVAETESTAGVRVGLRYGGLATSSVLGRRWTGPGGAVAHHVLDPRTGVPVDGRWRTASVWASSALAANVASTWFLVEGDTASTHVVGAGLAARLVDRDGAVSHVGGWPAEEAIAS